MKGKISNPILTKCNRDLFSYASRFRTPRYAQLQKEQQKMKLFHFGFLAILFTGIFCLMFLQSLLDFWLLCIITVYIPYYMAKMLNDRSKYHEISIISEETCISFGLESFVLSRGIRDMTIRYDDPYLKIEERNNYFWFTCFWGEFSFSNKDMTEGSWEKLAQLDLITKSILVCLFDEF